MTLAAYAGLRWRIGTWVDLDGLDSADLVPAFWLDHYDRLDDVEFVSTVQTALPGVVHMLRKVEQRREHVFVQPSTGAGVRVVVSHGSVESRRVQVAEIGPRGLWDAIVLAIGAAC